MADMFLITISSFSMCGISPSQQTIKLSYSESVDIGVRILDIAPEDMIRIHVVLLHALLRPSHHLLGDVEIPNINTSFAQGRQRCTFTHTNFDHAVNPLCNKRI